MGKSHGAYKGMAIIVTVAVLLGRVQRAETQPKGKTVSNCEHTAEFVLELSHQLQNAPYPGIFGDFNGDSQLTVSDLDELVAAIAAGQHARAFDMTKDGLVNLSDRDLWLLQGGLINLPSRRPYLPGDATLDGVVDETDFGRWNENKFTKFAAWSRGDFDANGTINTSDFWLLAANLSPSWFSECSWDSARKAGVTFLDRLLAAP